MRLLRIAVHAASVSYLSTLLGLTAWAVLPSAVGWNQVLIVGSSMNPVLHRGDVMAASPVDDARALQRGHVIVYDRPGYPGQLVTHRVVGRDKAGDLITRGDANGSDDTDPVTASVIRGMGRLAVPVVGRPIMWLRDGDVVPLLMWFAGTVLAVVAAADRSVYQVRPHPPPGRQRSPRRRLRRTAVTGTWWPAPLGYHLTARVTFASTGRAPPVLHHPDPGSALTRAGPGFLV